MKEVLEEVDKQVGGACRALGNEPSSEETTNLSH